MSFADLSVLFGLFISTTFTACRKADKSKELLSQLDVKNVAYGRDSLQVMDVFLPAGRDTANTKVILFIHSGSWSGGDKDEFFDAIPAIRTKLPDYAIF